MARSTELTEAISGILVQEPFFACLLMDLLEIKESDTVLSGNGRPNPTAYTNGRVIVVNPAFFKKLNVKERIFVLAHEICHVIMAHPERMRLYADMGFGPDLLPFKPMRFNIAGDYVINAYLNELKVGAQPMGTLLNGQVTKDDLVDDVYLKVPDDDDQDAGWDGHEPADPNAPPPSKAQIQQAVAQAAAAQKSSGTMPAGLQRLVDSILEPQVKWAEHLRGAVITTVGNNESTWARPNRRRLAVPPHAYWPGRTGTRTGPIALEIDTSGSIGDDVLKVFLSETHGILTDVMPEKIFVMFVDAKLHNDEVIEIDDPNEILDLAQKAGGGGGTDMGVVFRELEERDIGVEYVVVLTDGYCDFGEDRGIPTIWCITTDVVSPWGTTIHIKIPTQA